MEKAALLKKINTMKVDSKRSQSQIKNGDILLSYIGLLYQGKTAYEDIREMSADLDYYELALGITRSIPSAETLRQRMDDIGSSLRKNILDATPMDNSKIHKEEVFYTYKGFFGYAPMMAYIGAEGFLVNTELREGSQHCQCNTQAFLSETLDYSHQLTQKQLFVRMDSGNDAAENLGILIEDGSWFIVKRNLRRSESKQEWLDKAKECC